MIIVVSDGEIRGDETRLLRGQVETIQASAIVRITAARVVDQSRAVGCPVRRFKRLRGAVDELAAAGSHFEDFQMTSNVIPVRNEVGLGRAYDAHVAESRVLDHVRVVRTEEQAGINIVAERQISLARRQWFTETRRRDDVIASFPLK